MKKIIFLSIFLICSACGKSTSVVEQNNRVIKSNKTQNIQHLSNILASQDEEHKSRHQYRHPLETLTFFGITPGMTVVEVLPGGGWYSKVLAPYLGSDGELIGVDYAISMWPHFNFGTPEFVASRKDKLIEWQNNTQLWGGETGAASRVYSFDSLPDSLVGQIDSILFIRALHNLARFEEKGGYLTHALQSAYHMLKPGGTVGIVQHQVSESREDNWADGSKGYLKLSFVKKVMADAGFIFMSESHINSNVKDQPGISDIVWRLPPSLSTSKNNEALKAKYLAVGESNRMTLKFRKPY